MRLWILATLVMLISACSLNRPEYVRFTQELRLEEGLSNYELAHLQYYICPSLIATQEARQDAKAVEDGTLVRFKGRATSTLEVPAWTPGIAVQATEHFLAISFEEGSFFAFGVDEGLTEGDYRPMGRLTPDEQFEVPYRNQWFNMETFTGGRECAGGLYEQPRLWIDQESLKKVETSKTVLPGIRVQKVLED